jgi:hypothetical protein
MLLQDSKKAESALDSLLDLFGRGGSFQQQCESALAACNNDVDKAAEMMFAHPAQVCALFFLAYSPQASALIDRQLSCRGFSRSLIVLDDLLLTQST